MATSPGVLGQSAPSATTNTTLYTVGTGKSTVVTSLTVCNRGSASTFRVAVRPNGDTLANAHYLYYDAAISGNQTLILPAGLSLGDGDVITVYAGSADLSFTATGFEIT